MNNMMNFDESETMMYMSGVTAWAYKYYDWFSGAQHLSDDSYA